MLDRLYSKLGVRPSERRMVTRLFWLHFILIASYTLARATRDAVFLEELRARRLPYLFIAVAVCTAVVSTVMARRSIGQRLQRTLAQSLTRCGVVLLAFVPIFHYAHGPLPPIAFYLWTGTYGLLLVSLFWVLVNEAIDPREAKRLFGIIGAGGILGGMAAGASIGWLGAATGAERLLYGAGALLFLAVPLVHRVLETGSSRVLDIPRDREAPKRFLHDPYVRLVALMFLLGGITASLLDYQFKVVLERSGDGQAGQIARYLGIYYMLANLGSILLQVAASAYLLKRFGANAVSSLLPAGIVVGSALTLLLGAAAIPIAATRLYEAGLRNSIGKTAWEFLFFPLAAGVRRRVKTFIDAVVDRSAEALAGLLILAVNGLLGGSWWQLAAVTLVFACAWYAANSRLKRAYVRQLSSSLHELVMDVERKPVMPREASLMEESHRLLDSHDEKRARYAFELLETIDPEGLQRRLGDLQRHPVPAIRARALKKLADPKNPVASPLLRTLVHDESMEVRSEALRLYSARFADTEVQMSNLLASGDDEARGAALFYLVSHTGPEREVEVGERIDRVLESGNASDRRAVAQALGVRRRPSSLHRKLLRLLEDPSLAVRREAVVSCGKVQLREFIPALIARLQDRGTREAARSALAGFGNRVVGTLGDWLDDDTVSIAIRRELPLVLAAVATQESANELLRAGLPEDPLLLLRLLKAQNKIRVRNPAVEFPRLAVREALQHEVDTYLQLSRHLDVWRAEPPSRGQELLRGSLDDRLDATLDRIFRRLGLLYPAREVFLGYRAFAGSSRRTRAQALEYLEALLLPEDRRLLVPLLDASHDRRALLTGSLYGLQPYTRESSLEALVRGHDAWLQACALYVIGVQRVSGLAELVRQGLRAAHPLVRETAAWGLDRLEAS
jgi:AAA family ATP:ADP antiporter